VLNPRRGEYPSSYCNHKDLCEFAGEGPTPLPIPGMRSFLSDDLAGLLEESIHAD
jgi:hypothetical protein